MTAPINDLDYTQPKLPKVSLRHNKNINIRDARRRIGKKKV